MSTETAAGTGLASMHLALPRRSTKGLIAISIYWFALNFHWAAVGVLLVQSQVIGLLFSEAPGASLAARADWTNTHAGLTQAIVVAPGLIVALIVNPFFGLLSDRTPGRFGRRRPYILGGTLVNVVGLGIMALAPFTLVGLSTGNALAPSILVMMAALILVQIGSNAAAAPFHALLPDLVPQEQRGLASGFMGMAYWLGTICGSVVPLLFGFNSARLLAGTQDVITYQRGLVLAYAATSAVILLMAVLTVLAVREQPWYRGQRGPGTPTAAEGARPTRELLGTIAVVVLVVGGALLLFNAHLGLTLDSNSLSIVQLVALLIASVGAARAFEFRPRRNPDFSWVVATRALVMMGIYIVQSFLVLYMQNVAHAPNPQAATTLFLVIMTIIATASTLLAGWASDRVGRKRLVYISGSFMAAVGAVFVVAPYVFHGDLLALLFVMGAIFGLGFGAYVSVDWALVADVLPSEATFARDMGIWNIALTLPQVFAVIFGGWLLALGVLLGSANLGFTLLFVCFVVFLALGTVTVRNIRGIAR